MKATKLERLYGLLLLTIFGGIVVHAPLTVYLGVQFPQWLPLIKSWKEVVMLVAGGVAAVVLAKRSLWREIFSDRLIQYIAAYSALHLALAVVLGGTVLALLAGLAIDLRFVVFFGLVYVLMKLAPQYRRSIVRVVAVGAIVVVGFGCMQFFLPKDILSHIGYSVDTIAPYGTVDKNPAYIRINSTLRGPNPLGAYVVIVFSLAAAWAVTHRSVFVRSNKARWVAAGVTVGSLAVLYASYSRSSLLGMCVALAVLGVVLFRSVKIPLGPVVGVVGVIVVVLTTLLMQQKSFVENVLLHDNADTPGISSNEAHVSSIVSSLGHTIEEPLGTGIGSVGSASLYGTQSMIVENQYLFEAHEAGWLGVVLFVAITIIVLRRLWQRRVDWLALGVFASGVGMLVIGVLLPVWADDTVAIVWWGLAAVVIGGEDARQQANKKTT